MFEKHLTKEPGPRPKPRLLWWLLAALLAVGGALLFWLDAEEPTGSGEEVRDVDVGFEEEGAFPGGGPSAPEGRQVDED